MKQDDVLIFSYTRAQAIADGVLVDVSELAKQAGFRFPVAVTAGVWAECVAGPAGVWAGRTARPVRTIGGFAGLLHALRHRDEGRRGAGRFRGARPQRQSRGRPAARSPLCPLRAGRRRGAGYYRHENR